MVFSFFSLFLLEESNCINDTKHFVNISVGYKMIFFFFCVLLVQFVFEISVFPRQLLYIRTPTEALQSTIISICSFNRISSLPLELFDIIS